MPTDEFQLDMIGRDGSLRSALLPIDGLPDLVAFLGEWHDNPERTLTVMTESGVVAYEHSDVARCRLEVPLC